MTQSAVNKIAAMSVGSTGSVAIQGAQKTMLNMTGATLVKTGPGVVYGVGIPVTVANGTIDIYDAADTSPGSLVTANKLYGTFPLAANSLQWQPLAGGAPFTKGLVIVASAGVTVTALYS
jgi:hypothetical protein